MELHTFFQAFSALAIRVEHSSNYRSCWLRSGRQGIRAGPGVEHQTLFTDDTVRQRTPTAEINKQSAAADGVKK